MEHLAETVAVIPYEIPLGVRRDAVIGAGDVPAQVDQGLQPLDLLIHGFTALGMPPTPRRARP